jgi:uncharacterized protein (TIGR03089 family)
VQLAPPPGSRPRPSDVAAALRSAQAELGHRPCVTVLGPHRRDEQGAASLAQWAAKGAHLLELDLLVEPGDHVGVRVPPGWTAAAVALAVWWRGAVVDLTADGDAHVAVVQEGHPVPRRVDEVLWVGDAADGSPIDPAAGEAWVQAVQAFPDQPPPTQAAAHRPALVADGTTWTQAELLAAAAALPEQGTLGLDADTTLSPSQQLAAVALRPLLVGRPTVVLRGRDRQAAAGERVTVWR